MGVPDIKLVAVKSAIEKNKHAHLIGRASRTHKHQ